MPKLQYGAGLVEFLSRHRGHPIASPALLGHLTGQFVAETKNFAEKGRIPLFSFPRQESKDRLAQELRRKRPVREAVVFIGTAQEKAYAFSAHRLPGKPVRFQFTRNKSVLPNYYYFYLDDAEWGESFLKVCSYAPWGLKLYLNGHEWLKRQLAKEGIGFEALDNGFLSCQDPQRLQALAEELGPKQVQGFLTKWLDRLPLPLSAADRAAGYDYRLSIRQLELSLTQIMDRPVAGRQFFEEVIRDNLDLGRPDRVQLIFPRKIIRTTPGSFRTRVLREGVHPSLHISYKRFDLKQYYKEGRGLRNRDLRGQVAALLGLPREQYSAGQASYDLRRLLRKGLLCRALNSQRYYLTPYGWKLARLYARLEARIFRPALTAMNDPPAALPGRLKQALAAVDVQFDELISQSFPARQAA